MMVGGYHTRTRSHAKAADEAWYHPCMTNAWGRSTAISMWCVIKTHRQSWQTRRNMGSQRATMHMFARHWSVKPDLIYNLCLVVQNMLSKWLQNGYTVIRWDVCKTTWHYVVWPSTHRLLDSAVARKWSELEHGNIGLGPYGQNHIIYSRLSSEKLSGIERSTFMEYHIHT